MNDFKNKTLTIAGSDSGAGAGVQADLKTFASLGVYGTTVITAVTAQNTIGVQGFRMMSGDFVAEQINSVMSDIKPRSVKTGMLGNSEIINAVSNTLKSNGYEKFNSKEQNNKGSSRQKKAGIIFPGSCKGKHRGKP